jgi:hypothetical protein
MVRRYEDPVEVRPTPDGEEPGSFLWRGRLYVVRDVLGHWRERRAWWTSTAARALHGEGAGGEPATDQEMRPGEVGPGGAAATVAGGMAASTASTALAAEREVWRVEASRGQVHGSGVFELSRDVGSGGLAGTAGAGGRADAWRLVCVAD